MTGDPVALRRAQVARAAVLGKRAGYTLLLFSVGVFAGGAVTRFTPLVVRLVVGALAAASVVLLPSIILGYAVAKAEREDPGLPGSAPPREDAPPRR